MCSYGLQICDFQWIISVMKKYLFIFGCAGSLLLLVGFLWLQQVEVTLQLRCVGFSLRWLLLLCSRNSRAQNCRLQQLQHADSVIVIHRLSCPTARGIFLDQGLNLCPLHWQVDYPLDHQGNPALDLQSYSSFPNKGNVSRLITY